MLVLIFPCYTDEHINNWMLRNLLERWAFAYMVTCGFKVRVIIINTCT